jgi:hypothetical protein
MEASMHFAVSGRPNTMVRATLLLLLTLLTAAPASAGGVLATPPVWAFDATVLCGVQNLGDEPASVVGSLRDSTGNVLSGNTVTVEPGYVPVAAADEVTGYRYCTFEGLTKGLRGYIMVVESGSSTLVLPATR